MLAGTCGVMTDADGGGVYKSSLTVEKWLPRSGTTLA